MVVAEQIGDEVGLLTHGANTGFAGVSKELLNQLASDLDIPDVSMSTSLLNMLMKVTAKVLNKDLANEEELQEVLFL